MEHFETTAAADEHASTMPVATGSPRLPEMYTQAKAALAACERIGEAPEWADKSLALAEYAKVSRDRELEMLARRIRCRAIRRLGQLLLAIPVQRGRRTDRGASGDGTRTALARAAGVGKEQHKRAVEVAQLTDDEFDRLIEVRQVPGVARLAKLAVRGGSIGAVAEAAQI